MNGWGKYEPKHHRLGTDAGPALVIHGPQGPEEECRMHLEAENPQAADDAGDAQVVVVETSDPVLGSAVEVGAGDDFEVRRGIGVVVVADLGLG